MQKQNENLMTDKIKDKEQRKALNAWAKKTKYTGSIIAGTGFGKSRVGILAIDHILNNKSSRANLKSALILVVPRLSNSVVAPPAAGLEI